MWPQYDDFTSLSNGEQDYFRQHIGPDIADDSCIGRAHRMEVKRYRSNPEHVPKWKRREKHDITDTQHTCTYPKCHASSANEKIIVVPENTKQLFAQVLRTQESMTLCGTHYQCLYRQTHVSNPCVGCGAKPMARQSPYNRHSPDAITISHYLQERTGFDVNITPSDTLCKSCYDSTKPH